MNTNHSKLAFPTALHQAVAEQVRDYFLALPETDTVLAVNSCARGKAVPESDLDFAILVKPGVKAADIQNMEAAWKRQLEKHPLLQQYLQSQAFAQVHLDVIDGRFEPTAWDDGGGPDYFEIEIGNRVAHAAPMGLAGPYFLELRRQWLPYYDDTLQASRWTMARDACANDLEHVPFFTRRGLYFQAFDRLYKAFQEFLQALFISRKVYPIAYNKWIREQVEEWLGLPELYRELPVILSIQNIESGETAEKAKRLFQLLHMLSPDDPKTQILTTRPTKRSSPAIKKTI